ISGSYSGGFLSFNADQYGGAGGTGIYPEIFASGGNYTLTLTASGDVPGVNYFGLWFSALDAGNDLKFYENGTLLLDFTPTLYQQLVGACPNASNAFCGNPNSQFLGQDSGEQFAFLNFFDTNGYFNEIVFTETGGGGFESDNHTVGYQDPSNPSGTIIGAVPEPSTFLLMLPGAMAFIGLGRRFAFKVK
ncbi:MAG TPA: PEP-CTERM sorting domain-containing protein, partial [Terracidiphilus sp.]|nr:PEP-CTERM sorting domain-containing protein [Terracidiphilus sp.]